MLKKYLNFVGFYTVLCMAFAGAVAPVLMMVVQVPSRGLAWLASVSFFSWISLVFIGPLVTWYLVRWPVFLFGLMFGALLAAFPSRQGSRSWRMCWGAVFGCAAAIAQLVLMSWPNLHQFSDWKEVGTALFVCAVGSIAAAAAAYFYPRRLWMEPVESRSASGWAPSDSGGSHDNKTA
jgi:hypothetical protein